MKHSLYNFILSLSIVVLFISIGYRYRNYLDQPIIKIIVIILFLLIVILSILYLVKMLKHNKILSFLPIIFISISIYIIFLDIYKKEKVDDLFYIIDVEISNIDSLKVYKYHFEESTFYKSAIYEVGKWYTFDYFSNENIFISFPYIRGNIDLHIKEFEDKSYKAYFTAFDVGAPDVIGDEISIGCWPEDLAFEFYDSNIENYEYKKVNKIIIDFSKQMKDLSFFKNIVLE